MNWSNRPDCSCYANDSLMMGNSGGDNYIRRSVLYHIVGKDTHIWCYVPLWYDIQGETKWENIEISAVSFHPIFSWRLVHHLRICTYIQRIISITLNACVVSCYLSIHFWVRFWLMCKMSGYECSKRVNKIHTLDDSMNWSNQLSCACSQRDHCRWGIRWWFWWWCRCERWTLVEGAQRHLDGWQMIVCQAASG
jgi:hypothetical protein